MKTTLAVLFLVLATTAGATTYYVATNGSSGNDGLTTGTPWPLTYALANSASNDTILVMPGTYTGHWATSKPYQLISSQVQWKAVLTSDSPTLAMFSFWPTNGHSSTLNGFRIVGSSNSAVYSIAGTTTVANCWISDCGTNAAGNGFQNGIEIHDQYGTVISNNLIEYCGTYSNGGWGAAIYVNGTNLTVMNNVFRYNQSGIEIYRDPGDNPSEGSSNVFVYGNLIYGNVKYGGIWGSQYGRTFLLENNTVLHTNGTAFFYIGQVAPFLTLACTNNIFYSGGGTFISGSGTMVGDYNLMDTAHWIQAHGVVTNNAHLKDTSIGQYWLAENSPARGAALSSACAPVDFFGAAQSSVADVGAFQWSVRLHGDYRVLEPSPANPDYWSTAYFPKASVGTFNLSP